jgi:N-acetylglutamate synthase
LISEEEIGSITFIEELSMNAWPSLQTMLYDGWILRFSEGYTRRANSVNPLYQSKYDLNEKIAECERLYFGEGIDTVFKMTNASFPLELDQILSERGYQHQAETSVQVLGLEGDERLPKPPEETTSLFEDVSDEWLSSFCEMNAISDRKKKMAAGKMLMNTLPPKRLASISNGEGKIVACGLAVLQAGYIGLFDIVTLKEFRRRGLARQLTLALLHWGKENHASKAYLQVVIGNEPALNLYRSLGFVERYRYWYRVKKFHQA